MTASVLETLRPEARLLLLSAGGEENDAAMRELTARGLDWPLATQLAEWERASGVFWRRLQRIGTEAIPREASEVLQRLALVADFRASFLERRLRETLAAFGQAGIGVVLLKGAALARWAYPSFAERPMGDVDLLVDPSRAQEAYEIARATGWRWHEELLPAERYERHHHLPPLHDASGVGTRLEVHTALLVEGHPFRLSDAEVRGESELLADATCEVRVPGVAHHLVHLAVHFGWSDMMRMGAWRTFRDLDVLMRGPVDWARFVDDVRRYRATSVGYWMLRLSRSLAGVAAPAEVEEALRPARSERALERLERHLAQETLPAGTQTPSQAMRRFMWELAVQPEESGHGSSRPWEEDDSRQAAEGQERRSPFERLSRQVAGGKQWGRYLRVVLLGR